MAENAARSWNRSSVTLTDGLLGRNWLAGAGAGDRSTALLAAPSASTSDSSSAFETHGTFFVPVSTDPVRSSAAAKQTRPLLDACTRNDPAVYFLKFNY